MSLVAGILKSFMLDRSDVMVWQGLFGGRMRYVGWRDAAPNAIVLLARYFWLVRLDRCIFGDDKQS